MKNKNILTIIIFILITLFDVYLFIYKKYDFLLITIIFTIMILVYLIKNILISKMDDQEKYKLEVNKLIKIYRNILVNVEELPNTNKSLLKVNTLDDLLNAQYEIKKPIFYITRDDSTMFYVIDSDVILYYLMKQEQEELSVLEIKLKEYIKREKIEVL